MAKPHPLDLYKRLTILEREVIPLKQRVGYLEEKLKFLGQEDMKYAEEESVENMNLQLIGERKKFYMERRKLESQLQIERKEHAKAIRKCVQLQQQIEEQELSEPEHSEEREHQRLVQFFKTHGNCSKEEKALAAVKEDNVEMLKQLLCLNYDVNTTYGQNKTLLFHAVSEGKLEIVKLLVKWGADVNAKSARNVVSLHEAAFYGHADICLYLIQCGALVNAVDNLGWSSLHTAAFTGQTNVAKVLIDNGADFTLANNDGYTPRQLAFLKNVKSMCELFRSLIKGGNQDN